MGRDHASKVVRFSMARPVLVALLLLSVAGSGCLGGEERSEWAYQMVQLDRLADQGRTGTGVRVAVLDTGINLAHPSLDHLDDGDRRNGELVAFRDFYAGSQGVDAAHDDDGHGTHVVGIMSARGSDLGGKLVYGGVDLLGGSPSIELVVAKVCEGDSCRESAIANAIRWSVSQGARVVSMSLGGVSPLPDIVNDVIRTDIESAIDDALARGVVFIAAAGNDGPANRDVSVPSDIPGVISVGMVDADGRVDDLSSRGDNDGDNQCRQLLLGSTGRCDPHRKPELVAPGVLILSAWTGDAYVKATGTSQATPFVTSVVALLLEGKPPLKDADDVAHLKRVLMDTARKIDGQDRPHDDAAGYGIVQALAAQQAYV